MAKPAKYPKKFRQKLEKVRSAREAREAAEELDDGYPTSMWRAFLPKGSVALMAGRIDETLHRIYMDYAMRPPPPVEYIQPLAPWIKDEPAVED
jgi:hypothetical protein